MTRKEELIIFLEEGCNKMIKSIKKISSNEKDGMDMLQQDLGGLLAVIKLLAEDGHLDEYLLIKYGDKTEKKIERYMSNKGVEK